MEGAGIGNHEDLWQSQPLLTILANAEINGRGHDPRERTLEGTTSP